jgi:hypothetical protein
MRMEPQYSKIEIPKRELEELKKRIEELEIQFEKEKSKEKKERLVKEKIREYIYEVQKTPFLCPSFKSEG